MLIVLLIVAGIFFLALYSGMFTHGDGTPLR